MTRAHLLLDPEIHEALRRRAFDQRKSISEVAREILRDALCRRTPKRTRKKGRHPLRDVVGIVSGDGTNVSERHDEFLTEDRRW